MSYIFRPMNETTQIQQVMYTLAEAAPKLGVKVSTVRRWVREGRIKSVRTSSAVSKILIPSEEIVRFCRGANG